MTLDNDTRGWIMTCLSAIACVFGSACIYVDLIVRILPGKKGFRIQDSNAFLSSSMSLSSGVMLFSALYRMLPSSRKSLEDGGCPPRVAAWILILLFLGGVFGIQFFSRIMHHFLPSHTVGCDHSHDDEHSLEDRKDPEGVDTPKDPREPRQVANGYANAAPSAHHSPMPTSERTPLLKRSATDTVPAMETVEHPSASTLISRPTLQSRVTLKVAELVNRPKPECDSGGPCYGYTDPCGQDCFKKVRRRGGLKGALATTDTSRVPTLGARNTWNSNKSIDEEANIIPTRTQSPLETLHETRDSVHADNTHIQESPSSSGTNTYHSLQSRADPIQPQETSQPTPSSHHHHIPTNAFLSISLQTSIAIALHKLPEGFITYATNHANPHLGASIFIALFIHNLTEGFALALPIFLASGSRTRALTLASILGGASQPLGAGIAAAWLAIAEKSRGEDDIQKGLSGVVYGGMFAITAGIMASVGLSLLRESLELGHRGDLCMVWTFVGMGVLGVGQALNA